MTEACCNCLYYNVQYWECRNPSSKHYEHRMKPGRICDKWEYEKQFDAEEKRRHNGKER